tara:strand:+ start:1641 stop:2453 length:813 start_codon:yes stop_codon:yes gene_type:complete
MNSFDHDFYTKFYPDLKDLNKIQSFKHYINWGKKENRKCNETELILFQNKTNKLIKEEYKNLNKINFSLQLEKKINILIRTSNRPKYFNECIKSVLSQQYKNYHVFICYDDYASLEYLNKYKDNNRITFFYVHSNSIEKYKFNLYCNDLLKRVKTGYVLFLDDDNMFCHDHVLRILNKCIDETSLLVWKFYRPDKLIYPTSLKEINLGDIDTSSFCSNIANYLNCDWKDKKNGDFRFINNVLIKNKIKLRFLNKILTKTQFSNKIGNLGN